MKAIINPRFRKNTVTVIEYSSSEENAQDAEEYWQEEEKTLVEMQKELLHMPSLQRKGKCYRI